MLDHETVSATFHGKVEPGGMPVTSCVFEYGTSTDYGKFAPCKQTAAQIGTTGDVPVSAEVNGLLLDRPTTSGCEPRTTTTKA